MVENRRFLNIITHIFLVIGVIVMIFPVWIAFMASTYTGAEINSGAFLLVPGSHFVENYWTTLTKGGAGSSISGASMMLNSLYMALTISIGKIIISLMSAFALIYFRFPFRKTAFWIIFLTLMLPIEVRIIPTYQVMTDLSLLNTYAGLSVPLIASATATFLYRQFFLTIPDEIAEAARVDGAGPWRFFWDIIFPMSRTNTAALFVILFIYGWNQYLWPLLIAPDASFETVVMGISKVRNAVAEFPVWNIAMTLTILAAVPPVFLVIVMRKMFVRGLTDSEK